MAICPNCGNQTGEGAVFCDQCGTRIPVPEEAAPQAVAPPAGGSVICPACGAGNVPGEAFCDYCGSPLEAPMPTPETSPELEPVSADAGPEVALEEAAPAAEAPPAPATEEPALGEVEAKLTCPACGEEVAADEAFCANCGASLAQPPIPPEPVAEEVPPVPEAEVEPEPVPEPVVAEAPAAPPAAPALAPELTCPACGAEVEAGDTFCSNCGAALKEAPAPTPAPVEAAPAPPPSAGPRLVVSASGAEIPLPAGDEIFIGREDPVSGIYPEVDLTPHGGEEGGVSRRHARITVEGNDYFVEDLDSTNFTFVNKQKLAPNTRHPLNDGDELRCGRVVLTVSL